MAGTPRNTTNLKGSYNLQTTNDGEVPTYCVNGVPIGLETTKFNFSSTTTTDALGVAEIYSCTDATADRTLTISSATIALGTVTAPLPISVVDQSGELVVNGTSITIDTEGSELIDGESSIALTADYGGVNLYTDGSNLYSTINAPNHNITTQPSAVSDSLTIDIFSAAQMTLELAPDGVMRWKPILGKRYKFHGSITLPKTWIPTSVDPTSLEVVEFTSSFQGSSMLLDGDNTTGHIWGRNINSLILRNINLFDTTPQTTWVFDLVGTGQFSTVAFLSSPMFNFKQAGNLVNTNYTLNNSSLVNVERGMVVRNDGGSSLHSISSSRITNLSALTMETAYITFIGTQGTVSANTSNIGMASTGSAFCIDSAATGSFDIVSNSFDGVGNFFSLPISNAITAFANVDVAISSFSDSADDPGVDTSVNFAAATNATIGQTVLIADEAAYNGSHVIVRVADDQLSFDINVVFSTSGAGTLKRTQVTSANHGVSRDQTNTISGTTSYNATTSALQIVDNDNFVIPSAFVADDATGTISSTTQDQDTPGVIAALNGKAAESTVTAEATLTGNALVTDIPLAGAMVAINATTWTGAEEIRASVSSDGSTEYLGEFPDAGIKSDGNVTLEPATASKLLSCRPIHQDATRTTVTFTNGTNLINETSTPLVDGDLITFRDNAGTLPAELRDDIVYFIVSQATNTFQVSYTSGGAAIAFTDDGSGTNTYATCTLHGIPVRNTITAANPRTLVPQALITQNINDKVFLVVTNEDDAVNITVSEAYYRSFV